MTSPDHIAHARHERAPGASDPANHPSGWRLSPGRRKLALATHILISVGLFGIYAVMLILGTIAAATPDPETSRAAYRSMGILGGVIPPAALGALGTGVILALGTPWGLFTHSWVVVKLALTVVALPVSIVVAFPAVRQAIAATSGAVPLTAPDAASAVGGRRTDGRRARTRSERQPRGARHPARAASGTASRRRSRPSPSTRRTMTSKRQATDTTALCSGSATSALRCRP